MFSPYLFQIAFKFLRFSLKFHSNNLLRFILDALDGTDYFLDRLIRRGASHHIIFR